MQAFLIALQNLMELLPTIGAFVQLVHPTDGEAARVQTATNIATAGLTLAGVTAETIQALHPTIASAIAPASQAPAPAAPGVTGNIAAPAATPAQNAPLVAGVTS